MAGVADRRLLAERLHNQLLSGEPARSVVDVVRRILAVQAQDPRGARLAIRSRSVVTRASDVDAALNQKQALISTLNRGTLHLVTPEDYWLLHPLTTPQLLTANARRLAQEHVSPDAAERAVAVIEQALSSDGPLRREDLKERIAAADVPTAGQAFVHVVMLATIRGLVVRGPMVGGEHAFVLTRDWLGSPPAPLDRDDALGTLARRYLRGHGPACDRDLAKWAGINLADARSGLRRIAASLTHRDENRVALTALQESPDELPPPRLLGSFEPCLLGWESREQIIGPHTGLVTNNGLFRPFALVRGRAVATWTLTKDNFQLRPLQRMSAATRRALEADSTAVVDFLRT